MKIFILMISIFLFFSCSRNKEIEIGKEYLGVWYETQYYYTFFSDGTFKFRTEGHYGNVEDTGVYGISNNQILLSADSYHHVRSGVLMENFAIINKNCIRDLKGYYYCSNMDDDWQEIYNLKMKEEEFQDSVKQILAKQKDVKKALSEIEENSRISHNSYWYDGIVKINKVEHHIFQVKEWGLIDDTVYLNFFVTKNPFKIYRKKRYELEELDLDEN